MLQVSIKELEANLVRYFDVYLVEVIRITRYRPELDILNRFYYQTSPGFYKYFHL
jgi:hypothetical protein